MGLLQEFAKINKVWPTASFIIPFSPLSNLELFELGYFTASDVPFRCISIKLNPGSNHLQNIAILYNSSTKQFISLFNKDEGLVFTVFEENKDNIESHLVTLQTNLTNFKNQLAQMPTDLRTQLTKCILVERKVDETMHQSLSKELSRKVYFAIGECRERAALIPVFQNSKGADLVQLALHKWMDFAKNQDQDQPFPTESTMGLVKNFIQIKKWLKDLITNQLAGISTLVEEQKVD